MRRLRLGRNLTSAAMIWVLLVMPMAVFSQTQVKLAKNKYKVQQDVEIGNKYSQQVEQQMPVLNDAEATRYIQNLGRRLVNAIPREFQQPAFNYRFKIINARDINAFALPGGPMYVNRGLIQVAKNEGELAGVMSHEISHVALRHGTAQATRQSGLGSQLGTIGLILGGAILGGQAGAQAGAIAAAAWQTKYSRAFESDSDILGARIMANAGYDPRDLANMFRTIAAQSQGGRPPEFLSSHPDPGKRYEKINREAELLRVSNNPIKFTQAFARVRERLGAMPRARSMAEIQKEAKGQQTGGNTTGGNTGNTGNTEMSRGRYSSRVQLPSSRTLTYQGGNLFTVRYPRNWRQLPAQNSITFSPTGAYGDQGFTHGAMIGIIQPQRSGLERATEDYVKGVLEGNTYLRQRTNFSRTSISGRQAYAVRLSGPSPITRRTEEVIIYTTLLRDGKLFYYVGVTPQRDRYRYYRAFNNMVRSIRLNA
ncbi:MAG: M48 family metalloprotease [Pyrinomonadaceae bacterium]|nr:M48 family metalloprotease [Pyrinomonadaceae bacterium]